MNVHFLVKQTERLIEDNAPTILAGVAIAGTVATAYLTARATIKAVDVLQKEVFTASEEHNKTVSKATQVKAVWMFYIPPVAAGATTIACIVGASHMNTKRAAAMAAAYSLSEKKFTAYRDKVAEKFGVEKHNEVKREIDEDRTRNRPAVILGGDDVLCFDSHSGRYFKSSMESIRGAVNDTNFEVIQNNYATLQFFWELIGLDATAYSEEFGWTADCPLVVEFATTMSSDDKPCLVVNYDVESIRRWNHFGD